MLPGHTRGLVGRGVVRSAPFRAGPTDRPGTLGTHVLIEWNRLRPITDPIGCERLAHQVPAVNWAGTYSDVLEVPDQVGDELDRLWDAPSPAPCTSRGGSWATLWGWWSSMAARRPRTTGTPSAASEPVRDRP